MIRVSNIEASKKLQKAKFACIGMTGGQTLADKKAHYFDITLKKAQEILADDEMLSVEEVKKMGVSQQYYSELKEKLDTKKPEKGE